MLSPPSLPSSIYLSPFPGRGDINIFQSLPLSFPVIEVGIRGVTNFNFNSHKMFMNDTLNLCILALKSSFCTMTKD